MWYSGSAVSITSCAEAQERLPHLEALHGVGHEVAVRQHRALRHAGRAAGVLQRRDAVVIQRVRVDLRIGAGRDAIRALRQRLPHRRVREGDRRHHLLDVFLHRAHEDPLQRRQQIRNG